MREPTKPMRQETLAAGFFESKVLGGWGRPFPKIQLLTIEELLSGKGIELPPIRQVGVTFKKAARVRAAHAEDQELEM